MKHAVEARIYNNGKIIVKIRDAKPDETDSYIQTKTCDIWVDIFDSYSTAQNFARQYKNA